MQVMLIQTIYQHLVVVMMCIWLKIVIRIAQVMPILITPTIPKEELEMI